MSGSPFRLVSHQIAKATGGHRKADRQDERDPPELAEPLSQQLKHLLRRLTRRRCGSGAVLRGLHEKDVPCNANSVRFAPSYHIAATEQRQL